MALRKTKLRSKVKESHYKEMVVPPISEGRRKRDFSTPKNIDEERF